MGRSRDIAEILGKTETDNPSNLVLLNTSSPTGVDSAQVQNIGVEHFSTVDSLPITNLEAGQQAYVSGTNRLYMSNGSGWFNVALINATPYWDSEPLSTYEIVDSQTPLIITAKAFDSDGPSSAIVNQSFGTDSAQYMVNISNDSSVFTFTPKSVDSIGIEVAAGNLTDSNGDFTYTFKWSDGINFVSKAVTIGYNPVGGSAVLFYGSRAFNMGGDNSVASDTIQIFDMSTTADATDFADLTKDLYYFGAASSGTRVIAAGGSNPSNSDYGIADMQYFETSIQANAQGFGTLTDGVYTPACAGSTTRHLTAGGNLNPGETAKIDYVAYDTTGNAADFGDRTEPNDYLSAASDATYAVFGLGDNSPRETMDYVTIDTPGNATDFGDTTVVRYAGNHGVIGDTTRGLFAGGYGTQVSDREVIDYITFTTPGNSVDFGNLINRVGDHQSTSDGTYGFFMGGGSHYTISKVTIQTLGNATSHASLLSGVANKQGVGASGVA